MKFNFIKKMSGIIDEGYRLFEKYNVKSDINFDQEYGDEIKNRLISFPVADLSLNDIKDYLCSPRDENYLDSELKHYLPRIIELFIQGEELTIVDNDVFMILNKISHWELSEIEFLEKFSLRYFLNFLELYYDKDITFVFYVFRSELFNSNVFFAKWLEYKKHKEALIAFSSMLKNNQYFIYSLDEIKNKLFEWSISDDVKCYFEEIIYNSNVLQDLSVYNSERIAEIEYLLIYFESH